MKISRITMRDFKRFKGLTIELPSTPSLVVVTGTNGSGKSAILEAMNHCRRRSRFGISSDPHYVNKFDGTGKPSDSSQSNVEFHGDQPADLAQAIWVRSAYRHEADFNNTSFGARTNPSDDAGVERLISSESLVSVNHARLLASFLSEAMAAQAGTPIEDIRDRIVGSVSEPPREYRRLQLLREWSHETIQTIQS